jgi:hypothetical protein
MNLKALLAASCVAAAGTYAFADEAHHPNQPQAAEAPAKPASKSPGGMGRMHEHMKLMQEHMKDMQDQMAAIRSADDPKERARLVDEHMKSMQEGMSMMQGTMMPGMMKDDGK